LLPFSQTAYAQKNVNPSTIDVNKLSDAKLQKLMQEIQSRGLTQEQAMDLARAEGVSQSQLDQLMVRLKQQQTTAADTLSDTRTTNLKIKPSKTNISTKANIIVSEKNKKIFGYHLFNSDKLTFEPDVNIPVPLSYILGIGDQLAINVWGASQTQYQLTIEKNGAIIIPDLGPLYLAGMSFEKGQSLILKSLKAIYNGMAGDSPNTWAEVTLGALRSIRINVLGEVNVPGTYTLPSTASAFNALYLSGGPNENGTFRGIRLIRDGITFKTIDVYNFLINADPADNVQLREQDILFIPPYQTRVEAEGEIKRTGFFEIKDGETIKDLIRYGGGFSDKAYTRSLSVVRNNDREHEVRSVAAADFSKFTLQNGDVVTADSILNRFSNRVAISGAVFHPGNYEFTNGMKLSDLIKKADGLREDAFMNRAMILRQKEDNSPINLSVDLKEVMRGNDDVALQKEDKVLINSIFQMREARVVSIKGEVINPGTFEYQDNMTLGDLVFRAGGFKEMADSSVLDLTRRLSYEQAAKLTDKTNEVFQFTLPRNLQLSPADAVFKLKAFDEVNVRRAPGFRDQGTFLITGEVVYTGDYTFAVKNERISDAIKRAGGLTPSAFLSGATLTRINKQSIAELEKKKQLMKIDTTFKDSVSMAPQKYFVTIDLNKIMADPYSNNDLIIQPGDEIYIPRDLQTVKISGNVMNPIALTYQKKLTLREYIDMAGGYNFRAKKSRTYVIYPNGTTASTRGFLFKRTPGITPGSEIIVPTKPVKKETDNTMKWISIASGVSSLAITLITLINITK
jgi:protein involved in polysaccharide export with SLBB domain